MKLAQVQVQLQPVELESPLVLVWSSQVLKPFCGQVPSPPIPQKDS